MLARSPFSADRIITAVSIIAESIPALSLQEFADGILLKSEVFSKLKMRKLFLPAPPGSIVNPRRGNLEEVGYFLDRPQPLWPRGIAAGRDYCFLGSGVTVRFHSLLTLGNY